MATSSFTKSFVVHKPADAERLLRDLEKEPKKHICISQSEKQERKRKATELLARLQSH